MNKLLNQKLNWSKYILYSSFILGTIVIKAQSHYSEVYNSREIIEKGVEFFGEEKFEDAISQYDKVTRTDIDYLRAQYEKAYSLFAMEKYDELETLLKKFKDSGEINEMPGLYVIYGNMLSVLERYDESEHIYLEGKKIAPKSNGLLFNQAIMYIRSEQRQKAVDVLKELQEVNPNNATSHYLLGLLAFEDGQVVPASLGFLAYLMMNPNGTHASNAIIKLNTKFGGISNANPTLQFSETGDDFSELELILKNELALSTKYNLKSSIDDIYTRQVQAVLDYLPTHVSKGGFFETYYVPWLAEISKRNLTENFTYYTLISFENQLGKQLTSQKKKIETFYEQFISQDFWELYAKRNRMHFGQNKDVTVYLKNGLPYSQGVSVNGKSEGPYYFFNEFGQILSELNYKNNELDGVQHYNYPNLQKSDEVTYVNGKKNGPFKNYYWNGALKLEGSFLNDENHGIHTSYYPNGGKLCEFNLSHGVSDGKNTCYWPNGTKKSEYTYVNGKAEGPGFMYNEVGDIVREAQFANDFFDGKVTIYFDGKQVKSSVEYKNGEESNNSQEYYANNQISKESFYKNGVISELKSYDASGKLLTHNLYDNKGKITESRNYTNDEIPFITEIYKNDKINKILLYYPNPESPQEINPKNAQLEVRNVDGVLIAKGQYKDYLKEGEWTYYYSNGEISFKENYEKGVANGLRTDYNKGNILNFKEYLKEGNTNGLIESYEHDNVYLKSYYQDNQLHGPYQYFYPNGNISSEGFFVDGEQNYFYYNYFIDGTVNSKRLYVDDHIVQEIHYDKNGNVLYDFDFANKTGKFEIRNPQNQLLQTIELKNGIKDGWVINYQLDGTKTSEVSYVNDVRHGGFKRYFPNGKILSEGDYYAGGAHGKFNYYNQFGDLRLTTHYLFNDEYGETVQYFPNGKISHISQNIKDKEHGETKYYNYEGKHIASIFYDLGEPVSYKVLNAQGELGDQQKIVQGNAKIESKYPNGRLALSINFEKGIRQGKAEVRQENGQPISITNYKNDKLDGERLQYYENGKIFKKENFKMGDFHGSVEVFEDNGNPYLSSEYYYDSLHGKVKIYKSGKLEQTKIYDTNVLVQVL